MKRARTTVIVTTILFLIVAMTNAADSAATCGPLRGGEAAKKISTDIAGMRTLILEATGYSWGQAVWGEPRLFRKDGKAVALTTLKPLEGRVSWGQLSFNHGPDRKPLKIGGQTMRGGIFAHADSRLVFALKEEFVRFEALVGINHTAERRGSVTFHVSALPMDGEIYQRYAQAQQELTPACLDIFLKSLDALTRLKPEKTAYFRECAAKTEALRKGLDKLVAGLKKLDESAMRQANEFNELRRAAMTTLLDRPLLFVKQHPYMAGHIYDCFLTWHPGGGIYVLENPQDPIEKHRVRAVIDPKTAQTLGEGVYRDPDISWDGKRMLFAFKGEKEGHTSIYEIPLDGTGLRRVTDPGKDCGCKDEPPGLIGKGKHDIMPSYLPDGRIAFMSTRTGGLVMCFNSQFAILQTCNLDGSDVRSLSVNHASEFDPTVLPDGRILFGRWEYVDKTALYMQSLWTCNPDGTFERALFKNNLAKPTAVLDARPVPGSDLIVASLTPHNGQPVGAIAMIDPKAGKNNLAAITNFTPEYPTEMDQGLRQGPCDPWPLNKDFVLIANNDPKVGPHGVLQLIDRFGTRVTVHREPDISCYSPMPVEPHTRPPSIPSQLQPEKPALFLVDDIYRGLDGVERGTVKKLRVIETTSRISGLPPGGRWWNQAFLVSWQGSYDVKNFLGTVPVEADGSVYFEAPPGKPLYFQALDKDNRLVQSMRTFVQAAPGITRSCTGCHIKDEDATPASQPRNVTALRRPPSKLQPESWGGGYLDYATMVQPILDRNCVRCHGGEGGVGGGLDYSGGWTWAFNISYETFIKNTLSGFLNCVNGAVKTAEILPPRAHGSANASLAKAALRCLGNGKYPAFTRRDVDLLLAWMDGNCNYYGTFNYTTNATSSAILDVRDKLLPVMDKAGCVKCHQREIGNDWVNLQRPEWSRILRAPLVKADSGLGLAWCRDRKAKPVDFPPVTQKQQPPDVFKPQRKPAPDLAGTPVSPFAANSDPIYQEMLGIIRGGRELALRTPRVDMPGAQPFAGVLRQQRPLAPPEPPTAKPAVKVTARAAE
ncbi:MAG: NPCBM/NEW2 domain-containing protein [Verrucomicrobia bacterium]|nr:NPCBM/NEW2 domain-containing protein [Verrucomicrobiota bacterium]